MQTRIQSARRSIHLAIALLILISTNAIPRAVSADQLTDPPRIMAAGAPRFLGETATDDAFFAELESANMTSFLPFFEYQEVPEAKSLPREADFYPPCSNDGEPYRSMHAHGVKIVIPGNLLYAGDLTPDQGDAYLRMLIECAGEEGIAGILSVDEPALGNPDLDEREADVRLLYQHAKAIAPGIPVIMIHAPILTETPNPDNSWRPVTIEDAKAYLAAVSRLSVWADIIGFDLYIIPAETAKYSAPGHGVDIVDDTVAIPAYLDWLYANTPGKQTLIVLQGFAYADLFGIDERDAATRSPTSTELTRMACAAWRSGVTYLAWWGQSLLTKNDIALWTDIKSISLAISTDPSTICN